MRTGVRLIVLFQFPLLPSSPLLRLSSAHRETIQEKTYPLLARDLIESLIAAGHKIIIFNQDVLKVDSWLKYHPGGDVAILHMVGRDATDEINAYVLLRLP